MSAQRLVCLTGGLVVPLPAIETALNLEARGLHLTREGDDGIRVGPRDLLTDQDRANIRRWKLHLLTLLAYEAPSCG